MHPNDSPPTGLIHHTPHRHPSQPTHSSTPCQQLLPVPNPVLSYWLTQPHKYADLRSTPHLPPACDVAIIGSGMAGVLTAYHILQSNPSCSVVLLDARSLCSGATGRNGGHAKVKTATLVGLKSEAERNALQAYVFGTMRGLKEVVDREAGLAEECEFEMRRSFDVFQSAGELDGVKSVYEDAVKKGEEWTKHVAFVGKEMVQNVTSIRDAVGGFSSPAVSLWPYKFVAGTLSRMADRHSLERFNVQMNTPVLSVTHDNVLSTPRGKVQAGKVVFATNAWTVGLLPSFAGSITPLRGMASHHKSHKVVHPLLNNTYNIHFADSHNQPTSTDYLNPRPDGGIVVGGGGSFFRHDKPSWWNNFDDSVHFGNHVEKYWDEYMPRTFLGWEDSNAVPDMVWTGIMGYTSDDKPHIGRVPGVESGKWMLAGFNGGGMSHIAIVAKAVARMVVNDLDFEDVKEEFGLLEGCGTSVQRLDKT
ncbi:FAD dependent oxidoreductase-domain-containing protein [Phaeosphaeria sp. MPI-PUGE-AT-0046c]|nr:FAD dependent oxidoreductase-domain-containing protein [Phaeosphaeria sp. MPI-PUGE-AT-0046c]